MSEDTIEVEETGIERDQQLIDFLATDVNDRLRFQHEFSLAGFRTLVLINGGAIIALLTYASNVAEGGMASLRLAFMGYVIGLSATVVAYMSAYFSQGRLMDAMGSALFRQLGRVEDEQKSREEQKKDTKHGSLWIAASVLLAVIGLIGFLSGSIFAMEALT
ncbi:hypothetical protein [uncultured Croceicoccus sp.]|uniref:hypothetical protein n=1 Tax=uncultured Croceicoccus sp. TaxID=1295329 RepID=UPI00261F6036|nr:hypothetical protein [uncultured Croceicoccus sp.]